MDNQIEEWRVCEECEKYEVSSFGNVKHIKSNKLLNPSTKNNGYKRVTFRVNGKIKDFNVHRLVANNFLDNPLNLKCVDHIDRNKLNNNLINLRFVDQRTNTINRNVNGSIYSVKGKYNYYYARYSKYDNITKIVTKLSKMFKTREEAQNQLDTWRDLYEVNRLL